ncbi:MAG: peptidase U32 family protein [Clostridia bacterium]
MKDKKNIELLAPAGNIESFKAAVQTKADAIYMGVGKYNARTMAKNFDKNEYIECIEYAHKRGVKVYLTLNTLMYDSEILDALNIVVELYSKGLDAVIVQDIGLAMAIKEVLPNLALHASTQMSIYNLQQVKFLEKIGFKRIVLARELSVSQIEYICQNTDIEIEVFVHGALCVSLSGQCNLSGSIGDRSANRGACARTM